MKWERGVRKRVGANYRPAGIQTRSFLAVRRRNEPHPELIGHTDTQNVAKREENHRRCEAWKQFPLVELSMVLTRDAEQPTETPSQNWRLHNWRQESDIVEELLCRWTSWMKDEMIKWPSMILSGESLMRQTLLTVIRCCYCCSQEISLTAIFSTHSSWIGIMEWKKTL